MLGFLKQIFGTKYDRDIKKIMPLVEQTNVEWKKLQGLSHDELRNKTFEFRQRISEYISEINADIDECRNKANQSDDLYEKQRLFDKIDALIKERDKATEEILMEILPEAFAVVKETATRLKNNPTLRVKATQADRDLAIKRPDVLKIEGDDAIWNNTWNAAGNPVTWDMVHYDVQIIGGIVLHQGKIAEMATGEGKTLVATLPAYLNGLAQFGVHVVTVNNYLAKRDMEWMGPLHQFLHLTIDCIDLYEPHSDGRKNAYKCDITYGTNNEFGFDYLRDNMVRTPEELVQRKFHFAMVDEVDSVLVDDARTPLIISGPVPKDDQTQQYMELKPRVEKLVEAQRKLANQYLAEAKKLIAEGNTGNKEGEGGMTLLRAHRALPKNRALIKFLSEPGILNILRNTENFYMQEQGRKMPIVDQPLYFVIEEKQRSVELKGEGFELLTYSGEDPNLYVLPDVGAIIADIENSSMSNEDKVKAKDAAITDFSIKSETLHALNQLLKAYTLFEIDDEYVVIDGLVKIVDEQTGRIMEGRRYSDGLHQAIEAKENVKIEKATQTYATITLQNFFRMYHKLCGMTGTAETEAQEFWEIYKLDVVAIPTNRPISRNDKNDLIFKTDREKFNAVIDEIEKLREAGRPVLVGTTSVQVSELLSRMLNMRKIPHNVLNAKQHQREAEIVSEAGKASMVTIATNMAGRGTDIKLGPGVKDAGGLAIIGTERHDSRRVDRQLRGRAGRQGDPGSSQFFVSLEDKLMRLFGSDRIAGIMDRMGHKEGDMIEHSMVTKSIERAQKKVEENNFGVRKRLLEYDDVMNIQREAIYKMRNNALNGERVAVDISEMYYQLGNELISKFKNTRDFAGYELEVFRLFGVEQPFGQAKFLEKNEQTLAEEFHDYIMAEYKRKLDLMIEPVYPVVKNVYEQQGHVYKNIGLPYTDGRQGIDITANLEEVVKSNGKAIATAIEKSLMLAVIDKEWKEHLREMDELKDSVQAASFEQKDPLVIYKREAFFTFQSLVGKVNRSVISFLMRGEIPLAQGDQVRQAAVPTRQQRQQVQTNRGEEEAAREAAASAGRQEVQKPETFVRNDPKIGRNDACPCGSGKKYKQCHGK
jgi:preprotein translocase subunit SecA